MDRGPEVVIRFLSVNLQKIPRRPLPKVVLTHRLRVLPGLIQIGRIVRVILPKREVSSVRLLAIVPVALQI